MAGCRGNMGWKSVGRVDSAVWDFSLFSSVTLGLNDSAVSEVSPNTCGSARGLDLI